MSIGTEKRMERFWARVDKSGSCWTWVGERTEKDYGIACVNYKKVRAHRLAYELVVGVIPDGMQVCHRCDNPPCVRPDHLFLGTNHDNHADKIAKGRARGARGTHPHAKLTVADVLEIRRRHKKGLRGGPDCTSALVREFGVGKDQISRIVNRHIWGWLDTPSEGVAPVPVAPRDEQASIFDMVTP